MRTVCEAAATAATQSTHTQAAFDVWPPPDDIAASGLFALGALDKDWVKCVCVRADGIVVHIICHRDDTQSFRAVFRPHGNMSTATAMTIQLAPHSDGFAFSTKLSRRSCERERRPHKQFKVSDNSPVSTGLVRGLYSFRCASPEVSSVGWPAAAISQQHIHQIPKS